MDIVRKFKAGESTFKLKSLSQQDSDALYITFVKGKDHL